MRLGNFFDSETLPVSTCFIRFFLSNIAIFYLGHDYNYAAA